MKNSKIDYDKLAAVMQATYSHFGVDAPFLTDQVGQALRSLPEDHRAELAELQRRILSPKALEALAKRMKRDHGIFLAHHGALTRVIQVVSEYYSPTKQRVN